MADISPELIRIAARSVRVWRGGNGPALLLLHGGVGDAELHWKPVWNQLADSFSVAAPDLPGFGASAPLPDATFADWIGWIAKVAELLNLSDLCVVGNSFGAGLARLFAANYPTRVRRLVLVDDGQVIGVPGFARPFLNTPLAPPILEWIRRQGYSPEALKRMLADESLLTPQFLAASDAASHAFFAAIRPIMASNPPRAQTPTMPTLIIWGARDRHTSVERGQAVASQISGAQFRVIERAGHMPQLEQPEEFVRLVQEFCAS